MQRSSRPSAQKEDSVGVFRTLLVEDGIIQNYDKQIERLFHDAKKLGLTLQEPLIAVPKQTSRLKIIVTLRGTTYEIHPYTKPKTLTLTVYPFPVEGQKFKSLEYMNRGFIREYARTQGCEDALVTNYGGYITEASNANFFYEHKGEKVTACPSLPYLKGVTIDLISDMNFKKFRLQDIPEEATCYLCNSLMGILDVKLKRPS